MSSSLAVLSEEVQRLVANAVPALAGGQRIVAVAVEVDDLEALVAALLPREAVPGAPVVLQARRNAEARTTFLRHVGALTAEQVADIVGSTATNRSAAAHRLRRAGRLFTVAHQGRALYPAFQFDADGRVRPVVADVLAVTDLVGWDLALWFVAASGWLGDQAPVDLIDDAPDRVVDAARADAVSDVF